MELREAVAGIVARQRELGLDLVNEGEYTKGGDWLSFADDRFAGFETRETDEKPLVAQGRDREVFDAFYRYATERGTLFYTPGGQVSPRRLRWVCTGPIAYAGHEQVRGGDRDPPRVRARRGRVPDLDGAGQPRGVSRKRLLRHVEYLYALADALRVEYELIAGAGFVLQVDDAWLPALWDRIGIEMERRVPRTLPRPGAGAEPRAAAFPKTASGTTCAGEAGTDRTPTDLELEHIVDILLEVKAQAYLIEGANARHEHEWKVWRDVELPEGKILVPGVVTHSTDVVEHPDLVAQRIERFASVLGAENVIAGTDCGFGGRSHPQIAWAKLWVLTEGGARVWRARCSRHRQPDEADQRPRPEHEDVAGDVVGAEVDRVADCA